MSGLRATVADGFIYLRTPYSYKDSCKAIPGGRWKPDFVFEGSEVQGAWQYPAGAGTAQAVVEAFGHLGLEGDVAFGDLVYASELAQGMKVADSLPDIPITKTSAWLHQRQAYWFAENMRAVMLAMDMGTGKSKVAVDLAVNRGHKRILILSPLSVVGVWGKQFRTHGGKPVRVVPLLKGTVAKKVEQAKREIRLAELRGEAVAIVINYESAWRPPFGPVYDEQGKRVVDQGFAMQAGFDFLILDEVHRIKAPDGRASRFAGRLATAIPWRLGLTGTPMPHSPLDVFAQCRALDPGVFGTSFYRFKQHYARLGFFGQVEGYQNMEELNKKLYAITYRVTKDVLDLPEFTHETRYCALSPKAQKVYDGLARDFCAQVAEGKIVTAANALAKLLRQQQVTSGYIPLDAADGEAAGVIEELDSAKQDLLADVLEDLPINEPVVVFGRFTHDLDAVKAVAESQGRRYGELSGRTHSGLTKDATMAEDIDVLGVQIQAGGVGIDLTRARYAIYFSLGYSLGDYEQSLARVHRPGQTRPTYFVHLLCEGTVDQKVMKALEDRRDVVTSILDEVKTKGNLLMEEACEG